MVLHMQMPDATPSWSKLWLLPVSVAVLGVLLYYSDVFPSLGRHLRQFLYLIEHVIPDYIQRLFTY